MSDEEREKQIRAFSEFMASAECAEAVASGFMSGLQSSGFFERMSELRNRDSDG